MKLVILRSHLKECVTALQGVLGSDANLPVLRNIFFNTTQGKITVIATNLEIAIQYTIPGKIIESGVCSIPQTLIAQLAANLTHERVNLEKKNNNLHVITDNYQAVIQGAAPEDFPPIPPVEAGKNKLILSSAILKASLNEVTLATQFSELRPELNSVLFSYTVDALKLVATDSFRLAEKTIPKNQLQHPASEEFQLLIPLKTCHELTRILKEDEDVSIVYDKNQVLFSTETIQLTSRLISGTFPNYQAIIPKEFSAKAVIAKQELVSAVRLVGVFGGSSNEIQFRFSEKKKMIEVSSSSQAAGENTYLLSGKITGEVGPLTFNSRYLLDGLKTITGEEVFWGVNNESKPAILHTPNNTALFYILMPILKT
jgi:DNA polymerase-3 subunit beta